MLKSKQQGATMVEYSIMVALIAIAVAVTVLLVRNELKTSYQATTNCLISIAHGETDNCPGHVQE